MTAEADYIKVVICLGWTTIKVVTSCSSVVFFGGVVVGAATCAVIYKLVK